ncbi:hypothetical protein PIB30_082857 [Stylosanthes scabra]|uniref:Uncharacterized protein n=1 Tax=Stylosanthes scabra TaxID=79078 RepID=A0ABU6URP8_9FABA|nr:hypothetical protein [Stylosanthes scabra]
MAETIVELLVVGIEARSPNVPQSSKPPGPPVATTPVRIAYSDFDSDYFGESGSLSKDLDGIEYIPETPFGVRPRYILHTLHPILSLGHVPCFYQQLNLEAIHITDKSQTLNLFNESLNV